MAKLTSRLRSRGHRYFLIYQIRSYLNFLKRSTNQHGVHSPFVYDLVTKCFYDRSAHDEYSILKKYRQQLLNNSERIKVTDFGAGSRVFKSNDRKITSIAKNAGITKKRQRLLFRLVHYFKPALSLELGTSLGLGTVAIAQGHPNGQVTTIEGCPNTAAIAKTQFDDFQLSNLELRNETFEDFFNSISQKYDLVYIDGNHSMERTLSYFEQLLPSATNDSVFIFDDIYWSPEMTSAWQKICSHPKVTVSIDTFEWGLVFFRREQEKQHFRIRL